MFARVKKHEFQIGRGLLCTTAEYCWLYTAVYSYRQKTAAKPHNKEYKFITYLCLHGTYSVLIGNKPNESMF